MEDAELRNPYTGQTIGFVEESDDILVMESSYRPGGAPAPAHLHPAQEERFTVLSGSVRASIEGEERILSTGDELVIPAGTPHEFGGHADREERCAGRCGRRCGPASSSSASLPR